MQYVFSKSTLALTPDEIDACKRAAGTLRRKHEVFAAYKILVEVAERSITPPSVITLP